MRYLACDEIKLRDIIIKFWDTLFSRGVTDLLIIPGNVVFNYPIEKFIISHVKSGKYLTLLIQKAAEEEAEKNVAKVLVKNGGTHGLLEIDSFRSRALFPQHHWHARQFQVPGNFDAERKGKAAACSRRRRGWLEAWRH